MRILWATDGSAGATAVGQLLALWRLTAADEICLLRAAPPLPAETELHLCMVLPPAEAVAGAAPAVWASLSGEIEGILTGSMQEAEERLRGLAQGLSARGRPVTAEIDRGDPATHLIAA